MNTRLVLCFFIFHQNENGNEEERDFGELSNAVYHTYISAVGGVLTAAIFFSIVLMQGSRNLTDMWLAYWVSQTAGENRFVCKIASA